VTLDPLADYLEPRFGSIYADDLTADDGFVDYRPWTPDLKQAVTQYLVHEVTDEDYARFVEELFYDVPDGSREVQAAAIVDQQPPWEIAYAFHRAAVKAVPTLDQLIGDRDTWEDAGQQDDAQFWLEANATEGQLVELARYTNHPERNPGIWYARPFAWDLAFAWGWDLTPSRLLKAWHHVIGPADSDLTDAEWELLAPLLREREAHFGPVRRSPEELAARRRHYDGIRYRFANKIPWSHLPRRYGEGTVYQRFYLDKKNGVFLHLAQSLQGIPEAAGLVDWLKRIDADG
jgi:transposase